MPSAWTPCKLFVGGLATQTTTDALREHFSQYGRLVDAVVMSKQGRPRGFGFVAFEDPASAEAALAVPQWLGGRYVDVKCAVPGEHWEHRGPNKIFVGGLPPEATTDDLRACFAAYGPIADAVVMVDRLTKRSRGFGFIRFASGVQGTWAAEMVLQDPSGHQLGGKWVEVKRATPAAALQDVSPSSAQAASQPQTPMNSPSVRSHQEHQEQEPREPQQQQLLQQQQQQQWQQQQHQPTHHRIEQQLKQQQEIRRGLLQHQSERQQRDAQQAAVLRDLQLWGSYENSNLSGWAEGAVDLSPLYSPFRCGDLFNFDSPVGLGATPSATPGGLYQACDAEVLVARKLFASGFSHSDAWLKEKRPPTASRAQTPPRCGQTKLSSSFDMLASPMKVECRSSLLGGLSVDDCSKVALPQQAQPWQVAF